MTDEQREVLDILYRIQATLTGIVETLAAIRKRMDTVTPNPASISSGGEWSIYRKALEVPNDSSARK